MKVTSLILTLATTAFANPAAVDQQPRAKRVAARGTNPQSEVEALITTVRVHTANINTTLSTLPSVNVTAALNVTATGNSSIPNIVAEFNDIAAALNSSSGDVASTKRSAPLFGRDDTVACDATCQQAVYSGFGNLSSEISFTIAGCILKNAVDLSSSSSVVITVVSALATATNNFEDYSVGSIAGIVVQSLEAGLGTELGGALASLIAGP